MLKSFLRTNRSHAIIPSRYLASKAVPKKTDTIDSAEVFLTRIGRGMHAAASSKIPDWDKLFTMTSFDLKQAGLTPRQRKYLLLWQEKFSQGESPYALPVMKKVGGGERKRKAAGKQ